MKNPHNIILPDDKELENFIFMEIWSYLEDGVGTAEKKNITDGIKVLIKKYVEVNLKSEENSADAPPPDRESNVAI